MRRYTTYFTLFFLFIACAEKRGTLGLTKIPNYRAEEYIYAEECHKKGNLEQALLFYKLSIEETNPCDSLPYWWKAKLGRGDIYMELHRFQDAKEDFKDILDFAQRHRIDSALYSAHHNLAVINRREENYKKALTHVLHAQKAALAAGILCDMEKEKLLISAAYTVQNQTLTDSVIQQLKKLANDSNTEWKTNALKILILQSNRTYPNEHLKDFLQNLNTYHEMQLRERTEQMEHEKALLRQELNEQAQKQQDILFISLIVFALIICGCIYIIQHYKQKREREIIQRTLQQKEEFIHFIEQEKKSNIARLLNTISEKEQRMKLLENENKRMANDCKILYERIQKNEDKQKQQEEHFNLCRFFDTTIGQTIPTPENPYHPQQQDFEKLLVKEKNRKRLIDACNICFNGFAEGLQRLTPTLTNDDLMYCCLFKLNVRTKDIALMVCLSCSTISTRRKRIEMKMEKGSGQTSNEEIDRVSR